MTFPEPRRSQRIIAIQYLRGLAAISVVLYHAGGVMAAEKYQGNAFFDRLFRGFDSGVDLFFVISGFVLTLAIWDRRKTSMLEFFFGRALRIYPMAVSTTLLFAAAGALVMGYAPDMMQIATSLTLVPAPVSPLPVVLWTLKQELLFYAIISVAIINRYWGFGLFTAWALVSLMIGLERTDEAWLVGWFLHVQNFEFLAGFVVFLLWRHVSLTPNAAQVLFWGGLVALLTASVTINSKTVDPRIHVLMMTAICSPLVLGAAATLQTTHGLIGKLFSFLGAASYSIYLLHFFLLSLLNKIVIFLGWSDIPSLITLVIGSIIGGCAYYWLLEQRFESLRKRYTIRNAHPNGNWKDF